MPYQKEPSRNLNIEPGGEMGLGVFGSAKFGTDEDIWEKEAKTSQTYSKEELPAQ